MAVIKRLEGIVRKIENESLTLDLKKIKEASDKMRVCNGTVVVSMKLNAEKLQAGRHINLYISECGGYVRHKQWQYDVYAILEGDDGQQKFLGSVPLGAVKLNFGE
ncbi:MAG: exodeoxyribonuclease VII small subunit [archaeon]